MLAHRVSYGRGSVRVSNEQIVAVRAPTVLDDFADLRFSLVATIPFSPVFKRLVSLATFGGTQQSADLIEQRPFWRRFRGTR